MSRRQEVEHQVVQAFKPEVKQEVEQEVTQDQEV